MKKEAEIVFFKTQKEWEQWLSKNFEKEEGVFLQMYKKASNVGSVRYEEALDVALCYGWIDGIVKKYDEASYIQKFTPRRKGSNWSKINTCHIERLTKEGRMKPSGILEVEKAKHDGRWERASAPPSKVVVPKDFLDAISKNKKAEEFFKKINKSNIFALVWQIENAKKEETRIRRIKKFVEMFERHEKLY